MAGFRRRIQSDYNKWHNERRKKIEQQTKQTALKNGWRINRNVNTGIKWAESILPAKTSFRFQLTLHTTAPIQSDVNNRD